METPNIDYPPSISMSKGVKSQEAIEKAREVIRRQHNALATDEKLNWLRRDGRARFDGAQFRFAKFDGRKSVLRRHDGRRAA